MKTKTAGYILGFPGKKRSQTLGLHSQLPSLLWVMDTLPHKLSTAAEAPLLQDGPTRALWRAHLQERMASSPSVPLRCHVLEQVSPPAGPLAK